jgi:TDG/mug DNA glycosylase family protein
MTTQKSAEDRLSGLAPVVDAQSRILILGTFPSQLSLKRGEYYANPQNQFWKIMENLFEIPAHSPYHERIRELQSEHIALWDVIRTCRRTGSSDAAIIDDEPNDLPGFLEHHPQLRYILLNGKRGFPWIRRFVKADQLPHHLVIECLPSTSPANARYTLEEKIRKWQILKDFVGQGGEQAAELVMQKEQ